MTIYISPIQSKRGFSLIEVLIAVTIASIIIGVTIFTLKTTLDTYYYLQDDVFIQKHIDELLQLFAEGGYEDYGIKSSLEIIEAGTDYIKFVPPWTDDSHISFSPQQFTKQYILNRPFKAGSSIPIGEIIEDTKQGIRRTASPIALLLDPNRDVFNPNDKVFFLVNPKPGLRVQFIYHPDSINFPDTIMTIQQKGNKIERHYKKKSKLFPASQDAANVDIKGLEFQYYDNANREIVPEKNRKHVDFNQIPNITAVKMTVAAEFGNLTRKGSIFMNIRNTRGSGTGLIVREGTEIKIPNSQDIRNFSLVNIQGPKDGGKIVFEARSDKGRTWRVKLDLAVKGEKEVIKRFSVEYPAGQNVYQEVINLTTDLPLNFLTLGGTGRYDYDDDEGDEDVVDLPGEVQLRIVEMDAAGAALFLRP